MRSSPSMRAVVGAALITAMLIVAAPAFGYDINKEWGQASIGDSPFTDPGTGAKLPPTQVYPRGRIKDLDAGDCCAVRIKITVLGTSGQHLFDYDARVKQEAGLNFDRRVDTSPNAIGSVVYGLCRTDG